MESGNSPRITDPLIRRGFKLVNRLEAGINYSIKDLGYKEVKMIDLIQGMKNKIQREEMEKRKRKMKNAR